MVTTSKPTVEVENLVQIPSSQLDNLGCVWYDFKLSVGQKFWKRILKNDFPS